MLNVGTWLAGSTYGVDAREAVIIGIAAVLLIGSTPSVARWLDILPLGDGTSRSIGVNVGASRVAIVLLTALMTTASTLLVGPLSFIGLMAPHIARLIGLNRALPHLFGAALIGGLILVVADWCGRTLVFPFQVPAGLFATLLGGPYLMWLLRNRG